MLHLSSCHINIRERMAASHQLQNGCRDCFYGYILPSTIEMVGNEIGLGQKAFLIGAGTGLWRPTNCCSISLTGFRDLRSFVPSHRRFERASLIAQSHRDFPYPVIIIRARYYYILQICSLFAPFSITLVITYQPFPHPQPATTSS